MAYPVMPSSGDIRVSTRTTNGTMITVPAGRVFCYDINITNSVSIAGNGNTTVTWNGVGSEIADGTVLLQCVVSGLALTVSANTAYITGVVRAGANDCTISFASSGTSAASATVSGYFL